MTPLDTLGPEHAAPIASLCRRAMADPPSAEEVEKALWAPDQPAVVRGDPAVGVVATVEGDGRGFVRLLAVDPSVRGRGHGKALLEAAQSDLSHLPSITVGADAPYFLYPGVETTQIAMLCLLEREHFRRIEATLNMAVELSSLPPDPGGTRLATMDEADTVSSWMERYWPHWKAEVLRALRQNSLVVADDEKGITGFCAYNVNRSGMLGPVAVRPGLIGSSAGRPLLLSALHRMRDDGRTRAEVAWVGPIVPYARVGGTVSRVFFVYRKDLR